MNSENIKKVTNQAIEQLVEALNAGHSEALTRYLGGDGEVQNVFLLECLSDPQTVSQCRSRCGLSDLAVVRTPSKTRRKGHHDSRSDVSQTDRNCRRIKHDGRISESGWVSHRVRVG